MYSDGSLKNEPLFKVVFEENGCNVLATQNMLLV